jgi:hypothetical protein
LIWIKGATKLAEINTLAKIVMMPVKGYQGWNQHRSIHFLINIKQGCGEDQEGL